MAENLYQTDDPGGGFIGNLAAPIGFPVAHFGINRFLAGPAPASRLGFGLSHFTLANRARRRVLRHASTEAWGGMLAPDKSFAERWAMARRGTLGPSRIYDPARSPKFLAKGFKGGAMRLAERTVGLANIRTAAALARPLTGLASAYYTWGMLLPLAAEIGLGSFAALSQMGEQWRRGTPETSVGITDMATQQNAFTMRQASMMAAHVSQQGMRAALGSEADWLHS